MFDFQNLEVYKKAKLFYQNSRQILIQSKCSAIIHNQLSRASFSVVLNIAEGSGRLSKADRRNFFVISRSSVFECIAIYDLLHDQKIIESNKFEEMLKLGDELSRILYSMIKNLSNLK